MKKTIITRSKMAIVLAIALSMFVALPVWAAGGDGSGGGSNEPLLLESSSIADGTQGVAITTSKISLTFSKNVVNSTVKDNNAGCFSITRDDTAVPFTVEMADDQLYPESKNDIVLVFTESLEPSSTYVITVAPELQSKSGVSLGEEVKISFATTEGTAAAPAANTPAAETVTAEGNSTVATETTAVVEAADTGDNSTELPATGADTGRNFLLAIAILALGGALLVYRRSSENF